jgi:hypothetical protein
MTPSLSSMELNKPSLIAEPVLPTNYKDSTHYNASKTPSKLLRMFNNSSMTLNPEKISHQSFLTSKLPSPTSKKLYQIVELEPTLLNQKFQILPHALLTSRL